MFGTWWKIGQQQQQQQQTATQQQQQPSLYPIRNTTIELVRYADDCMTEQLPVVSRGQSSFKRLQILAAVALKLRNLDMLRRLLREDVATRYCVHGVRRTRGVSLVLNDPSYGPGPGHEEVLQVLAHMQMGNTL